MASRIPTLLELARENPDFARACCEGMSPVARQDFIAALIANRTPLRPLRKAKPEGHTANPTDLSVQLRSYAKLVGR